MGVPSTFLSTSSNKSIMNQSLLLSPSGYFRKVFKLPTPPASMETIPMKWNSDFIEKIREEQRQERESAPKMAKRDDNLLRLISKSLYGEKVHYALELIQNAEDCGSSSIKFIFEKDKIIVINDGDVFTPGDVEGICSVEPGRKKNKIGFFGVGFKSVFNITRIPQVISNDFNFEIENYICPKPTNMVPEVFDEYYSKERGSIFVLPQSEGLPTIPELIENFKEIDEKILLFLSKVRSVQFIDKVNNEQWSIEKPPSETSLISLKNGRTGQTTKWRVSYKDLPVSSQEVQIPEEKEGIESTGTRIVIAFPCDQETREAIKGSTLYCYLPTKKRTDMPFLVQADFVPTVGRGDIQDIDWNKWLLSKLGKLAADAIDEIKEDPTLGKDFYDFIPLKGEVQEPLMNILSDSMYDSLRSKAISRTSDSEWKKAEECVIPLTSEVIEIIHKKDLPHVFGKPLSYTNSTLPERAKEILTELGSSVFDEGKFIEFLSKEDLIRKRKPEWFLRAYSFLNEIFDTTDKDYLGNFRWDQDKKDLFAKLEETKFILTNQETLVPLKDPKNPDRLICYPHYIDLSEIKNLFTEGELVFINKYFQLSSIASRKNPDPIEEERRKKVKEFFEGAGVRPDFRPSHVIRDVIVPKYSSGKYKGYDDIKLYQLVNYIRLNWSSLESEVKNKRLMEKKLQEIKEKILLKSYAHKNGNKISGYMPASKIYFPERYGKTEAMEQLFQGIDEIYFLDPYYINKEKREAKKKKRGKQKAEYGWKKFAEILRVWSSPRAEKHEGWISISGKEGYDWVEKRHSTTGEHEIRGDSASADIQRLIEYCSDLDDVEIVRQRMTTLWQSLSENWKQYSDHCKTTYKYHYRGYQEIPLQTSSFLHYLISTSWIPTTNGNFSKPEGVFIDNKRNRFLLGNTVNFTDLQANQTFLRDIGVKLEPDIEQVINHIKEHKHKSGEKKAEIEKFKEIYLFISEKIEEPIIDKNTTLENIRKEFEDNQLLYIPRKDRSWWKPSLVFWRDHSRIFGPLRGYVEHEGKEIYPTNVKELLSSLGVTEKPSIRQALEVLEELKTQNDSDTLKKIVTKVYSYINDELTHDNQEPVDWKDYAFLTRRGNVSKPHETYFEDDEEYSKKFYDKVEFIILPFSSWIKLHSFLKAAGFKSFRENLFITKNLADITEIEGSEAAYFIKALDHTKKYLLSKYLETYERLKSERTLDKLINIQVYETSKINIDVSVKANDSETFQVNGIEKEAYYSEKENRLYVLKNTNLFSEKVAKEISRIFKGAENEVFPFLNSVLPKAKDDEALKNQLALFEIEEEKSYTGPDGVELLPQDEKHEKEEDKEKETEEGEKDGEKPTVKPPQPPKPKTGLIDPAEYYPETSKEYTPYQKTEGEAPKIVREIRLKKGKPGAKKALEAPITRTGTIDAEGTALQIVINYENGEARQAEDRHNQREIGYDIYSTGPEGEERFIEVKHFSEQEGTFKLEPHQHEKAKQEGDKYFVHVVTGLREGPHPKKMFIIQNPLKWLTPDPPMEEKYSDWKNAITKEYEFKKA